MAKLTVNIGTSANDRTGDNLRTAFNKINQNFTEVYDDVSNLTTRLGVVETGGTVSLTTDTKGSVFADDSTLLVDAINGIIPASVVSGTLNNNTVGTHTGPVDGDLVGSVFADNSTLLVDGVNGTIPAANLTGALPAIDGSALTGVGGGGLADVVDDTTPQLGGNLDVNGNSIVSVSGGDINLAPNGAGEVTVTGNATISNVAKAYEMIVTSSNAALKLGDGTGSEGYMNIYLNNVSGGAKHVIQSYPTAGGGFKIQNLVNDQAITFETKNSSGTTKTPLVLNGDGSVDIQGTVTIGTGSISDTEISNWNTAYGWGQGQNLIKAYAHVDVSSPITASADYNVDSVTSSATGKYDVTFTTALPNANYVVMLSVQTNAGSNNYTVQYYNRTTTGFQVQKFLNGTLDGGASGNFSFVIIQT
jgi:hypothetical protein